MVQRNPRASTPTSGRSAQPRFAAHGWAAQGFAAVACAMLGLASSSGAATHVVRGNDEATMLVPAGVQVDSYSNSGYRLEFADAVAHIAVDVSPLQSRQTFDERGLPPTASVESRLARAVAAGSKTRYDAVSRILGWIAANVRYELDRTEPQDARSVLERRSAYCTGTARLAVALLDALAIPAREVAGYVVEDAPAGTGSGFHRWIEVFYDDRGWVFSDPLASQHFVAATYLRLASSAVETDLPGPALLLSRANRLEEIDQVAQAPARLVLTRANGEARHAAALRLSAPGFAQAEVSLIGPGSRRFESLRAGSALFLGLTPATYELQIRDQGRLEASRQITFHGPVLADLEIVPGAESDGGFGGQ
ncbi:MAG: transglutaminase domain-containing protein [Thermoanaerobaculia bacterium]